MNIPLRVMSFNIRQSHFYDRRNRWSERRDLLIGVLRRTQPAVVGAQEVGRRQLDDILESLSGYVAIAHRRYGDLVGAYAPIFYDRDRLQHLRSGDFWLSPDPDGRRSRGWDAAMPRICTWAVLRESQTERSFIVLNTHVDQRGAIARLESVRLLAARLNAGPRLPRLVTLDLNAKEGSESLQILLDVGLRDTFRVARPDDEPVFTYHRFRGSRSPGRVGKVDYVLADDAWTVVDASIVRDTCDGRLPSDHYPVMADLTLEPHSRQ